MTEDYWWKHLFEWSKELLVFLTTAVVGLIVYIWKGHSARISNLEKKVADMQMSVVTIHRLEEKANEIKESVKEDHAEILLEVKQLTSQMGQSEDRLMRQLEEVRDYIFNHLNDPRRRR